MNKHEHKNCLRIPTARYLYNTALSSFLPAPNNVVILALSENFQNLFTKISYLLLLRYLKKKRVLVATEPTVQIYLRQRAVFKPLQTQLPLVYICLLCLSLFTEDVERSDCQKASTR
jgi:hypothetical protein